MLIRCCASCIPTSLYCLAFLLTIADSKWFVFPCKNLEWAQCLGLQSLALPIPKKHSRMHAWNDCHGTLISTIWVESTYQPRTNHVPATYQPRTNHVPTTYPPRTHHVPNMYQIYTKTGPICSKYKENRHFPQMGMSQNSRNRHFSDIKAPAGASHQRSPFQNLPQEN